QGERIRRAARKPCEHAPVAEASHLARVALHDLIAHRDLAVAADGHLAVAPHAKNRRAVEVAHLLLLRASRLRGKRREWFTGPDASPGPRPDDDPSGWRVRH